MFFQALNVKHAEENMGRARPPHAGNYAMGNPRGECANPTPEDRQPHLGALAFKPPSDARMRGS